MFVQMITEKCTFLLGHTIFCTFHTFNQRKQFYIKFILGRTEKEKEMPQFSATSEYCKDFERF